MRAQLINWTMASMCTAPWQVLLLRETWCCRLQLCTLWEWIAGKQAKVWISCLA